MAIFENPNDPPQPKEGVYGWYAKKNNTEFAIYIGQAGQKSSMLPNGTLFRGVSELQRNIFSSNSPQYNILDTDFIVGTAIKCLEECGYRCIWRHLSNEPKEEIEYVRREQPILQNQNNTNIKLEFKVKKSDVGYWKMSNEKITEAEREIYRELKECKI